MLFSLTCTESTASSKAVAAELPQTGWILEQEQEQERVYRWLPKQSKVLQDYYSYSCSKASGSSA